MSTVLFRRKGVLQPTYTEHQVQSNGATNLLQGMADVKEHQNRQNKNLGKYAVQILADPSLTFNIKEHS